MYAPAMPVLSMRAMNPTKEASVFIGRGGKNMVKIRNVSGAKVETSEPGKAFALVSTKIIEELGDNERAPTDPADFETRQCSVRLFVGNSCVGSVIGKEGSKIKEIQEESVARITVSDEPVAGSAERVVTISGVIDSIHRAVYVIGKALQDNQDRPGSNVHYRPMAPVTRVPSSPVATLAFGYPSVPAVPPPRGAVTVQVQQIFIPNDM
ncbi:hypothetical protein M427DRAFT_66629 [Gonapodya prolifera JEL478]|uniref:K Homology domain-containing protein n=1 Tax=Gonapodya prolifera (strain JEL478) TaxID=1344416 RepID=A0A139ATG2_GONPJ|nr:hypothetical protein M427DRAFT_66629 [Gonapodya prolifera JEL478]|eukprot:KXS20012.1 hypothetical protein M427DRAFT_66629 [Gonapodya prolifera JEL478]